MNQLQKRHMKEWVAALRSGKYKPGMKTLKHGGSYCVLGVGCDISNLGKWDRCYYMLLSPSAPYEASCSGFYLSSEILNYYGIDQDTATALSELNDKGLSFERLADKLEGIVNRYYPGEED